jgi:hypothetical protein
LKTDYISSATTPSSAAADPTRKYYLPRTHLKELNTYRLK